MWNQPKNVLIQPSTLQTHTYAEGKTVEIRSLVVTARKYLHNVAICKPTNKLRVLMTSRQLIIDQLKSSEQFKMNINSILIDFPISVYESCEHQMN